MRFPVFKEDVLRFQKRLVKILDKLAGMVKTDAEKREVSKLQQTVKGESSERRLSSIRRQLTRNYSAYSQGFDLFGPPLQQPEASAGEYKITVEADGKVRHGKLRIRNDPLLDK